MSARSGVASPGASRAGPGLRAMRTIVLGYDRTDSARLAAYWSMRQLLPDGRLVIVHACRPLHAPASPFTSRQERRDFGRAVIDELLLEGSDAMFDVDLQVEVSDSDPVRALLDAAERHHARAIVLGSESHSRFHRALGTVISELLKTSPVPVVTVPPSSAAEVDQALVPSGEAA